MQTTRHNTRFDCKETCDLFWNGSLYAGTVKDLSIVSMGVHFDNSMPDVEIGDECVVYLPDDQFPNEYKCKIIRTNTSDVALRIIGVKL